jgi:hypothetical protein
MAAAGKKSVRSNVVLCIKENKQTQQKRNLDDHAAKKKKKRA